MSNLPAPRNQITPPRTSLDFIASHGFSVGPYVLAVLDEQWDRDWHIMTTVESPMMAQKIYNKMNPPDYQHWMFGMVSGGGLWNLANLPMKGRRDGKARQSC